MKFEMDGLRELQERAKELDGSHEVSFEELFPTRFMTSYTDFTSIDELVEASGYTVNSEEEFANIPDDEWDAFIMKTTRFSSWEEMMERAAQEHIARKLGFK